MAVGRFGTLAIGVLIARLLGPGEFGAYAVAMVALLAVLSFNELGVSLAIVRWREDPALIAPTVNTISIAMSVVLTTAAIFAAPAFASAMGAPSAAILVQLLSLCVLIDGVVATPAALMQRLFRQDQRIIADQVNVWVGAAVSVGLALSGVGALSLVVGRLAGSILSALLFLRFSPLPYRLGLDRQYLRALLGFGLPLAGASMVLFVAGFLDQVLVGHVLGSVILGFYVLAGNLANWPLAMFSQPLRSVAPALFSRLQHEPVIMRDAFRRLLRPLGAAALPMCAVLSAAAPEIVRFVYGDVWLPAAQALRWLAVLTAFRILFEFFYDYLVVLGRGGVILRLQLVTIVALVPALLFGVHVSGINGAGVALVLVAGLVSTPIYLTEFHRAGIALSLLARATWLPFVVSLGCGLGALVIARLVPDTFLTLALDGFLMAGAAAAMLWRFRSDLDVLRAPVAT